MNKHFIQFREEDHSYLVDNIPAISVTTLLKAVGITKDYSSTPQDKLNAARDRGNYYDALAEQAIDDYYEGEELTDWQEQFINALIKGGIDPKDLTPQLRVGTTTPFAIAGTADFGGIRRRIIIDLKATFLIYLHDVKWQTNFYAWLKDPEYYDDYECYVMHYDEKSKFFTLIKLDRIPRENIARVVTAYQLGDKYTDDSYAIVDYEKFSQAFDYVEHMKNELKKAEDELNIFYDEIKKHMQLNDIKSFELANFKITYTPQTTRKSIDYYKASEDKNMKVLEDTNILLTKLGKDPIHIYTADEMKEILNEDEIKEYTKITDVKDRLTITPKKK